MVGGDDHLPALAPDNAATIDVKVPPSGPTIQMEPLMATATVGEADGEFDIPLFAKTGTGVVPPRPVHGVPIQVWPY